MQIALILALLVIITTLIIVKFCLNSLKTRLIAIIVGMLICVSILVFPLYAEGDLVFRILNSTIYASRTITASQDLGLTQIIATNTILGKAYLSILYFLFILIPLISTAFVVSFIEGAIANLRIRNMRHREVFIFSEINSRTLSIGQKIKTKENVLIYTNYQKNNIDENALVTLNSLKAIKTRKTITALKLKKNKCINFYLFSSDTNNNLQDSIELLETYQNNDNVWLRILLKNDTEKTILDSATKGKFKIDIIDENERLVFQLLNHVPLFLQAKNNHLNVLLVGNDSIIKSFARNIVWCGQMINHELTINILDGTANQIAEEFAVKYPELLKYNFNFINHNLHTKAAIRAITSQKNINYIVVASTDDEENISNSIFLRSLFMKNDKSKYQNSPIINCLVRKNSLNQEVSVLKNSKNDSYNINPFGSIHSTYVKHDIINSDFEKLAEKTHLSCDKSKKSKHEKICNFYQSEYHRRSSRAAALHFKYKIYSVLKTDPKQLLSQNTLAQFSHAIKNSKTFQQLTQNEHDRWMAYTRSLGYTKVSPKDVLKYHDFTNSHVHHLAQLHPFLVPNKDLQKTEQAIGKPDISQKDGDIILRMLKTMQQK